MASRSARPAGAAISPARSSGEAAASVAAAAANPDADAPCAVAVRPAAGGRALDVGKSRGSKVGSSARMRSSSGGCVANKPPNGRSAVLEQHVRDLFGVDRHDARRIAADLLQRTGEAFGLARELHRGGVGETLALPRHGSFDEPREQYADAADHHERDADRERGRDAAAVAAAPAAARVAHAAQQPASRERQHEDAEAQADQLLVEAHVAVQDVAELVRDDALQLGALEVLERAARHGDRGVGAGERRPQTR